MSEDNPLNNLIQENSPETPVPEKIDIVPKELTDEQKLKILNEWNNNPDDPPSLGKLVELCWGPEVNIRSKRGILVRNFLVTRQLKYKTSVYEKKPEIILTEEQKKYITEHYGIYNTAELAQRVFNNPTLHQRNLEALTIAKYIKEELQDKIAVDNVAKTENPNELGPYLPPKRMHEASARVNKYILDCISEKDKENTKTQTELKAIIKFCHQHRFVHYINTLKTKEDRDLFEGRYISQVWEKHDLTEPELELIINLCCDILDHAHMRQELVKLQEMLENCANDSEGTRISQSVVDALANLRDNIDKASKRIEKLTETIQGKRNERIDTRIKQDQSLINLIDFWKTHENRQLLLRLAEARKNKVKEEIKRIEDMPSLIAEIWGITPEEI